MNTWVSSTGGIDFNILEYGTTLAGLMNDKNSNIDPDEFLEYVHNIDLKSLNPNLELKKAINNLIGPKFIFTNGTKYPLGSNKVWFRKSI